MGDRATYVNCYNHMINRKFDWIADFMTTTSCKYLVGWCIMVEIIMIRSVEKPQGPHRGPEIPCGKLFFSAWWPSINFTDKTGSIRALRTHPDASRLDVSKCHIGLYWLRIRKFISWCMLSKINSNLVRSVSIKRPDERGFFTNTVSLSRIRVLCFRLDINKPVYTNVMVRESLESTQEMPFLDTKWFFLLIGPDQILESLDSSPNQG